MRPKELESKEYENDYLAFHPPLIRLQESAPHPKRLKVLWLLLALLFFLLIWAFVGRLDIVAVADGKLVPAKYLQIVQPSEAGRIKEILVREGELVEANQVIMRMDQVLTKSDLTSLSNDHTRRGLQLIRIDAELNDELFDPPVDVAANMVADVMAQYRANRQALEASINEEKSRLNKSEQELAAAKQQKTRLEALLPHYRDQQNAYNRLIENGFASELMVSEKRRELIEREQELATQIHIIASANASIDQSQRRLEQIKAEYQRDLHLERMEALAQYDHLTQELQKLSHRLYLHELKAPQAGIVKDLATHTVGTVVQPGTVLASLVPLDEVLKVEVWISNEDIGFVRTGQEVKLKFAPYRFQKYGMGKGIIEHISADAQSEEEARDAGMTNSGRSPLRFKAIVALEENELEMDGITFPLSVGMQTTAEILLGRRTVMEYLLSPIKKAWHESARER